MAALCCATGGLACPGNGGPSTTNATGGRGTGGATTGTGGGSGGGVPSGGTTGSSGGATGTGSGGAPSSGGSSTGGANTGAGGMMTSSSGGASATGGRAATGGTTAGTGGAAGGASGSGWSSVFPTFTKHTIASFSGGYATAAADIDHDGMLDAVALSSTSAGLVWFKNPSWTKYTITTKATKLIYLAPHDVDGDGDMDVAFISDFDMNNSMAGGTFQWAEAPADPTQSQDWVLHKIDAIPTSHRLRWADIDGDGKKELIVLPIFGVGSTAPAHAGAVQCKAYFVPADPRTGTWTSKVLNDKNLEVAHALLVADWDGDKTADLLTAANDGVDLFRPGLGTAVERIGAGKDGTAPDKGSSEVVLGTLGGARFIATIEFWHGTDAVIYTPGASATALWTRQVVGAGDFEHGHGMALGDFNGDGFDEVVGGGGQGKMAQIIYRYVPSSRTWDKIPLDTGGVAVSEIDVKDINGDGAPDILSIGGSPTNNVVWYENSR